MALTTPLKSPVHHKKLHGRHHRHSKHYLKTYKPFLPLMLLVIIGLAINIFWNNRTSVLGATTSLSASQLLGSTNQARAAHNQDPIKLNAKLGAAAQAKANDMAKNNYWSHVSPRGDTPWRFIKDSGYEYYSAGENLAYGFGNAEDTVTGWLNSRGHRANMLKQDYTEVGFGISTALNYQGQKSTTVIVAMYAEPTNGFTSNGFIGAASASPASTPLQSVSRIQLLTDGKAPWSYGLIVLLSGSAALLYAYRHAKTVRAAVLAGESFVVRHKMLDYVIVTAAIGGFILTRAAGYIH